MCLHLLTYAYFFPFLVLVPFSGHILKHSFVKLSCILIFLISLEVFKSHLDTILTSSVLEDPCMSRELD